MLCNSALCMLLTERDNVTVYNTQIYSVIYRTHIRWCIKYNVICINNKLFDGKFVHCANYRVSVMFS